ncbi:hypothetical protein K461DRAFT_248275 [Myriangium duriaei CBS 260.36]|uniref:Mitochondrial division protein 1 n=1 Tax=Myriangium duriaei CBS 260.36 TaxID=1168546 RepID=A0A9P4MCN4_9PEZI|nr:hypothetical protein K461DRAFT_248275 [Myriangium duriaei CBS 260.36]
MTSGANDGRRGREALEVLYDNPASEIDIVAVHGLGANVDWTWVWKDGDKHIHWLRDAHMLPSQIPRARIIAYNYDSRWHSDAPRTRISLCGKDLVYSLQTFRHDQPRRPVVFLGHSLGGLVICYALVFADAGDETRSLVQHTVGFCSLGTPFRGTEMQTAAKYIAKINTYAGSSETAVRDLTFDNAEVWDKVHELCQLQTRTGFRTFCFFELYQTDYGKKFGVRGIFERMVVTGMSARIHGWPFQGLYADHITMNKFCGPLDRSFRTVASQLKRMCEGWRDVLQGNKDVRNVPLDHNKLKIAKGAEYNSYADEATPYCLAQTRTDLIGQICEWAIDKDPRSKIIFWLCGRPGTGKSTISRTVCRQLDGNNLGASFFFKRGHGDRGNARRLFSTIASQLSDRFQALRPQIAQALDNDSALCEKVIPEQFDKLLCQPLQIFNSCPSHNLITIVIDALDECETEQDIRIILKLLGRTETQSLGIRVFVTSRPELPIQLGFNNDISKDLFKNVKLEDVNSETIDNDIRIHLEHRLRTIRQEYNSLHRLDPLAHDWPGETRIAELMHEADRLFIHTSTVCRYISSQDDPDESLQYVLQRQLSGLDSMYRIILEQTVLAHSRESDDRDTVRKSLLDLLGSIILLADPLPMKSLSDLLDVRPRKLEGIMKRLQSVFYVPEVEHEPVRVFHLSFRDFLINSKSVDEVKTHLRLASRCLHRLDQPGTLKNDICNLTVPGVKRTEITNDRIATCIPADVKYACCYWPEHFIRSNIELSDDSEVYRFLRKHFIHWMEALSWLGRLSTAIEYLEQLQRLSTRARDLAAFLDDARRFLLRFRHVIDDAPLQLYHSALYFAPLESIIRTTFRDDIAIFQYFTVLPEPVSSWTSEVLSLEGHTDEVTTIAISADGQTIASGAWDKTVRLWNARTGEEKFRFEKHSTRILSVAFSSLDGTVIGSADDERIYFWSTKTGDIIRTVEHSLLLRSGDMTFSPVLKTFLACRHDVGNKSLLLLDLLTDEVLRTFMLSNLGAGDFFRTTFSGDGELVVSWQTKVLHLWRIQTGEEAHRLEYDPDVEITAATLSTGNNILAVAILGVGSKRYTGVQVRTVGIEHTNMEFDEIGRQIRLLAFSHNDDILASGSIEGTITLWAMETGNRIRTLDMHTDSISVMVFSRGGELVASSDTIIRIWNVQGLEIDRDTGEYESHTCIPRFSPDGRLIATQDTYGTTIQLWRSQTRQEICQLQVHKPGIMDFKFSPNGNNLATLLDDGTIYLWNTGTGNLQGEINTFTLSTSMAFTPDGKVLITYSSETMQLLDLVNGKLVRTLSTHSPWRVSSSPSPVPNDMILIIASGETGVLLLDARTGTVTTVSPTSMSYVYDLSGYSRGPGLSGVGVAISPSAATLTIQASGQLSLWNVGSRQEIRKLAVPFGSVQCLVFSPDGSILAAALNRKIDKKYKSELRFWDASIGELCLCVQTIGFVTRLHFSSDGTTLRTNNGTFKLKVATSPMSIALTAPAALQYGEPWLWCNGQRALWLPAEFRVRKDSYENTIVFGRKSETLAFFQCRDNS